MQGDEAIKKLCDAYDFDSVLDIGSGGGLHADIFARENKTVTTCDYGQSHHYARRRDEAAVIGDYLDLQFPRKFDCIWCCHVLEHQRNPGLFLAKMFADLRDGGVIAITVPPHKPNIVGGHVTFWNAGLLLYQMILAGFDCRDARVLTYSYNTSVITRKKLAPIAEIDLVYDKGDIERLAQFFPFDAKQQFDGEIEECNWHSQPTVIPSPIIDKHSLDISRFEACPITDIKQHEFYLKSVATRARENIADGAVLEFGVHKGMTIAWICDVFDRQVVYGFDSFEGLPEPWYLTAAERAGTAEPKHPKGCFAIAPPAVPANARLVPGFFEHSLPDWLRDNRVERIRFLHIDSDLYSSAITILEHLNHAIVEGTVIAFDELHSWGNLPYDQWEEGEWRALCEWVTAHDRAFRVLARTNHVQCAIEILR